MKWFFDHRINRTTLVFCLCLTFLLGVGLAKTGTLLDASWPVATGFVACIVIRKRTCWALLWIVLFGLTLGWWRGSAYQMKLQDFSQYYDHKTSFTVRAAQDAIYGKNKQLTFDANHVVVVQNGKPLTGKISINGFGANAVYQGDVVQVTGKLEPLLGSYQGRISYAQMHVLSHHNTAISELRRRFAAGIESALPEPLASFAMGLLVGQRNTLPQDISQQLLMVGLTHIIAVSGYNLTILLRASKNILGKRSKKQGTILAVGLIILFLLLTGSSASIVRAAIVSGLSITAAYYGRKIKPLVLIVLAAAITGFALPYYVWSDTSWYLSFLAFYGVMVLAPLIEVRLPQRLRGSIVVMVALESVCAEAMTLPFILHTFGQMSFIGLVSNVLVVALIPLAMLLSLIAGISGMLFPAFAGWFAWPARILLTYMLDIAHILSSIPHVFVQHVGLSIASMLFLYIIISFVCYSLGIKSKQKHGIITDKEQSLMEGV